MNQPKFPNGALVMISDTLNFGQEYHPKGLPAMVKYTYAEKYGGHGSSNREHQYSLIIRKENVWQEISWYYENTLSLITDEHKLKQYESELIKLGHKVIVSPAKYVNFIKKLSEIE